MFGENILNTIGLVAQTIIVPVSFIGVILTIFWQQKIAKRRATLDTILRQQSDTVLLEQGKIFTALRNSDNIAQYALPENASSPSALSIMAALNLSEFIAIGISEKIIDERIYKRYYRTEYVDDWIGCKPFVEELRRQSGNLTYYCEIEALAKKWANTTEQTRV
ncbi:MAG: DUF4760 domain-containing protein [Proteobacteria bacterium]|nr:DUF4760 domain-containing protein [Pseudomonadota bacterium]